MTKPDSSWTLEFNCIRDLDELKLLHVKDVTHHYPRHIHEEYCVAAIIRGAETLVSRGERHVAISGDLLCINADDAHVSISEGVEYMTIQFTPGFLERRVGVNNRGFLFAKPVVTDPDLFRSFVGLYPKLTDETISTLEREYELVSVLEELVFGSGPTAEWIEPDSVTEVRRYLRSHYSENISLAGLASIAKLSPFHLVRVFKSEVGVSPHEFQTQVRITKAQDLLRAGHSITEAAIETGFFDQSHFSRNFKRITGLTPGTYLSHSNIVQDN